jgi:hypothetical protein
MSSVVVDSDLDIRTKKLILEVDGKLFEAVLASDEELAEARTDFEAAGYSLDNCSCGVQVCYRGYIWVCRTERGCRWFRSNVRCNG